MEIKYKFPKGFEWGSSVWAQGTEGAYNKDGKAPTVWDEYYRQQPMRFYNEIGPSDTLHWYEEYPKYIKLIEEMKHTSFRTSILWARLLPDGIHVNEKAVEFYKSMFQLFKDKGMELSIVLYWFDMPLLFEEKGGFTNRETIKDFTYYCETCFHLFDGLVDIWYIYNEPIVDVCFKYLWDGCYPNIIDFNLANQAVYHMIVAHSKVVETFKKGNYTGKIGTVLNRCNVYPRSKNSADLQAAYHHELLYFTCFDDGLLLGEINQDWLKLVSDNGAKIAIQDGDLKCIKDNKIDVLGLNIYAPERVKCLSYALNPEAPVTFDNFSEPYEMPGRKMNTDRGWEIYPLVVYDSLMLMKNRYGNPEMRITENGIGIQEEARFRDADGIIQDDYRIEYVEEHLKTALKAIEDGVNLKGFYMWSFIDLWSPTNQFKNCYGFYEYDLGSGDTKPKKSMQWYKNVTLNNGF